MATEAPCYLYGIVRAADADRLPQMTGVAGAPVTTVRSEGIAGVVGELDSLDLRANRADLLAHAEVVQAISDTCAVIPVGFGHLFQRAEQLRRELLDRDAAALAAVLDDVGDGVEVQVKISYVEDVVAAELLRSDRTLQRLRNGRQDHARQLELGRRFATVLEARREADTDRLLDRLGRSATRSAVSEPATEFGVADLAFLVRRDLVGSFIAEADGLVADEPAVEARIVGPMAPYSFVGGALSGVA